MIRRHWSLVTLLTCSLLTVPAMAQETEPDMAKVLLFGTFHFKDAGRDVVQVEDIDILSDENQAYIEGLTTRMAAFKPTAVLLEYGPENERLINERYQSYLEGEFELPANEIYQLGFRIAKKAGLKGVHSFDHREVQWKAEALFEYAEAHDSPEFATMNALIKSFQDEEAEARRTLSLAQLLARQNDPQRDNLNMDLYLATNAIGVDEGWVGADATSSWWERNFRMYARVQAHAKPGARVIAIGGSGHMAILKQLLAIDQRIESEDPRPYIEGASDKEALTRLLNEFLAGASVNDLGAHQRFWADDLIYTSSSGERFNKAQILERNAPSQDSAGDQEPEVVYTAEEIRIHQYDDTAIVAFRLVATQADPAQVLNYYNTGSFLRRDAQWQAVAWQATRIPDAE